MEIYALEDAVSIDESKLDFFEVQTASINEYQRLMEWLGNSNGQRCIGAYADNYGGSYINDDGELVVLLRDSSEERINEIKQYTENDEILTKKCNYSYNDLREAIDKIIEHMDGLLEKGVEVRDVHEDIRENCVWIGVKNLTEEEEKIIYEVIDMPCVRIFESDRQIKTLDGVDIKGGDRIVSGDDGSVSTLGFCANQSVKEGFVIAGHAGDRKGEEFRYNGDLIGTVKSSAYYHESTADAAFVEKSSDVNTAAKIYTYTCHSVANTLSEYPEGTVIGMYGMVSGELYGKLRNNNIISVFGDKWFYYQAEAAFVAQEGDSGGPVFIPMVVNGNVKCKLLGIVSGGVLNEDMTEITGTVFSKYYYIVNELGVEAIMQ